MTKEEIKQIIVSIVIDKQGCKLMDLVASKQFIEAWRNLDTDETVDDFVGGLVKEERLVEVNYVLPTMHYRLKTFLLPADTHIAVQTGSNIEIIGEE